MTDAARRLITGCVVMFVVCCTGACTTAPGHTGPTPPSQHNVLEEELGTPLPPASALPARHRTAAQICAGAGLGRIASASPTTVGAVRSILGGHGVRPAPLLPTALQPAPETAQAAWCWVGAGTDAWTAYLASPGVAAQRVGDLSGQAEPPVGEYPFR